MRILSAVAVLLGLVSSKTMLQSITGSWGTTTGIVDPSFSYDFGLGYQTIYGSGHDSVNSDILFESYAINFDSYISTTVSLNFFASYSYGVTLNLGLFDVTPYRQFVEWINPIAILMGNEANFDIGARAEYDLYFAELSFTNDQAFWTYSYDVADWIDTTFFAKTTTIKDLLPVAADFSQSTESFDSDYIVFSPAASVDAAGTWYGTQPIWKASVNGII